MEFKILHKYKNSRVGIIKTNHGVINTPCFVPVGTNATIKALSPKQLEEIGIEVLFANTYHLMLRGFDAVKKIGLHKFMSWHKPIMTDSGGFQAFSLGLGLEHGIGKIGNIFPDQKQLAAGKKKLADIDDKGVTFISHLDGKKKRLTPKLSMKIQKKLGADIIMAFDECTSPLSDYNYTKQAMERTHKWAKLSKKYANKKQALFGIIQGGQYKDLRIKSAEFIKKLNFPGYAIGGCLGKNKENMHQILDWIIPRLEENKPRHLLGIGYIDDIFKIIEQGIDMFDCVIPTRFARNGLLFISPKKGIKKNNWRLRIQNSEFKKDFNPIDINCNCYTCRNFSRAYLKHLFDAKELLAYYLATYHNVYFITKLVKQIRESILNDNFYKLKEIWLR